MSDFLLKVMGGVATSITVAFVWWFHASPWFPLAMYVFSGALLTLSFLAVWWMRNRFIVPLLDLYAHMAPLVADVGSLATSIEGLRTDIAEIKTEVKTNGGRSLKDFVMRLETVIAIIDARQRGLIATQARPTFEADANFNWTKVNRSLELLTTFGIEHLAGRGWVSKIHEDDKDDVMQEVHHARKLPVRPIGATFRFVTDDADRPFIRVRLEATPIPHHTKPDIVLWSGSLVEVPPHEQPSSH